MNVFLKQKQLVIKVIKRTKMYYVSTVSVRHRKLEKLKISKISNYKVRDHSTESIFLLEAKV